MTSARFCRFELRTTDVAAANEFYDAVLGGRGDGIVELPAPAVARGAVPHWLGHIGARGIGGADQVVARMIARGAMRLGPPQASGPAILRDPGGAVLALTDETGPSHAGVVWHQLNTADAARAAANYAELFGLLLTGTLDMGPDGKNQLFAWNAGEPDVGAIADVAGRAGVHTHWLFFFGVTTLESTLAEVRARGGKVVGPFVLPNGVKLAVCDDPQGAAFGVMEQARPAPK